MPGTGAWAVVLAAGAATRFGSPKQALLLEPVLAASYGGTRLHPVVLARQAWSRVPDEGARSLDAVLVPCDDLGSPGDVDFADQVSGD